MSVVNGGTVVNGTIAAIEALEAQPAAPSDELRPALPYCQHFLDEQEIAAVTDVLRSGWIARGPRARELETTFAAHLGAADAVSCSNGSAALEIALRGLGVGPGDEVVLPTLTWVATAAAVRLVGARPVFADVDPVDHNLDLNDLSRCFSERTRAVIAVDFAGVPHRNTELRRLCARRNIFLIEDAAHAFGARFADGTAVGADGHADVATFSFHPAKTMTTAEGGLLTTADPALARRLRTIRSGGVTRDHADCRGPFDVQAVEIASNDHMTELQAALGLVQLTRVEGFLQSRRQAFAELRERLAPFAGRLLRPSHPPGSSFNLFVVELEEPGSDSQRRDALVRSLHADGIRAHVHYPLLHRQPIFREDATTEAALRADALLPNAVRYADRALTLPLFPGISSADLARVADALDRHL